MAKVLVVGPGVSGRGGIAAVIQMHRKSPLWAQHRMSLLDTYDDRSPMHKVASALHAYLLAPFRILGADIVHVHLAAQISVLRKLPIVLIARLLRKPVIIHLHAATEESLFSHTPRLAVRFLFVSAVRVIALSQSWSTLILRHIPQAKVTVISNPVLQHPAAIYKAATPPVILMVGKLDARKGYNDLLHAAAVILQEFPAAQFWFAGHGEVEKARQQSEALGILHAVRLLGWVDRGELEEIYAQASIVVLPSYGEGVPMSVIEAMSHGIPVVCTPVGGIPEWVEHEKNGLLVGPGNIAGLAEQILRLLHDPRLATFLGTSGYATVQARCTLDMVSKRLEALYAEVLAAS